MSVETIHQTPVARSDDGFAALFERIADGASERERTRSLPFAALDLLRQARFGALRIDPADGGGGLSFRALFALVLRLGAADANVAHILRNHFTVTEQYIRKPRSAQARRWRDAVVDGAIIGLANTELGTPTVGGTAPDTSLTPDGHGYRLNGTKYYSTGTLYADYALVRATGPGGALGGALAAVIIPTSRSGVEIIDDWDGVGQRLTASGTTHFRNVRVDPEEAVFDSEGEGYGLAYSNTQAQLFLTTVNAGILQGILNDATALLRDRRRGFYHAPAARPADDPILQQAIGQIAANAFAAETLVLAAADALDAVARRRDEGIDDPDLAHAAALVAAKAKIIVDDLTLRSGSLIFDVAGASATLRAANLDRHWRNARTLASHNPASYKAMAVGAHAIHGTLLPSKGFF